MWLRHALRLLATIFIISACSPTDRQAADKLNSISYAYHYRSLDSTEHYAQRAMDMSLQYADGQAEAMNNLVFVCIARMDYDKARRLIDEIIGVTDNQVELLIAYIQQMRLCQRTSQNRAFYDYREQALRSLQRINEERSQLTQRQQQRLIYAESELAIVTSTYYYYVGLERQAVDALHTTPHELERDTAQYLNYLYYVGSGGMIAAPSQEQINQQEFDHLMRCFMLAQQSGHTYFAANSLEALAEHMLTDEYRERLMADNMPAFKYLNPEGVSDDSLAVSIARRSLNIFENFGDVYQIAGAHRTLASCYLALDDYTQALHHLNLALNDSAINQAPDLVASIREQLSVAYAAIDDKSNSDSNRNIYLDLQEQTRQDRSLEARAGQLEQEAGQLNMLIGAVVGAIVLLMLMVMMFYMRHRRHTGSKRDDALRQQENELKEQLAMAQLRIEKEERTALEQRAKVSLVNSITPLIDRILYTIGHKPLNIDYIRELTDNINEQNEVLTHWIQLRQGELSLHIETFDVQPLFDIVGMGRRSFAMKGIELNVEPTTARVKADRVLTLFMLNTLADNARKFTADGGSVKISATEGDGFVELSVSDTGTGIDVDELANIFSRKMTGGHGFGLLNCKGIIDKYRKLSQIFNVCRIDVESTKGRGSRFFFRLPKGAARLIIALTSLALSFATHTSAQGTEASLTMASAYADSAYLSNINGTYERTLALADTCRQMLNTYYRKQHPSSSDTLCSSGDPSLPAPEILWLHGGLKLNYDILLTMRNESAVAALALHEWSLYQYNNRIYTQLFKELSADNTLDVYCQKMQQSQQNKQVAIILLVLLLFIILIAIVWQIVNALGKAARRQQDWQEQMELTADEIARAEQEEGALHVSNAVLDNCLSALKHETMYYPSRIRQLVDSGDTPALGEVVTYYRELYSILSQQAMRQTEHTRLHLQHMDHEILGDRVLIGYMMEILRKQSGTKNPAVSYEPKDDKYVVCTVDMPALRLDEQQAAMLFSPVSTANIPFMLCRQIVRDHGEATNRRGCAIRAEQSGSGTRIVIALPRKVSKL